jgi:hypothetical protein
MRKVLKEVRSGRFARQWIRENAQGRPNYQKLLAEDIDRQIERVGASLRARMPWLQERRRGAPAVTAARAAARRAAVKRAAVKRAAVKRAAVKRAATKRAATKRAATKRAATKHLAAKPAKRRALKRARPETAAAMRHAA